MGFFHNGYIKSLKQLVNFYNTRDKYAYPVTSGHCPPGTIERVTCWPMPEGRNNTDQRKSWIDGDRGDSNRCVSAYVVGRLHAALSEHGYFYRCLHPLPPCASAICGVAPLPSALIP